MAKLFQKPLAVKDDPAKTGEHDQRDEIFPGVFRHVVIEKVVLLTHERGTDKRQQQQRDGGPYFQYVANIDQ